MKIHLVLIACIVSAPFAQPQSESSYVRAGTDGKGWAIGNALVEREIRFDPARGLYTASWRHKVTGTDFMQIAAPSKTKWESVTGAGLKLVTEIHFRTTGCPS